MHYQFWPLIGLIFSSDFYEFWVSVTHRTRACILSKNVYSDLHPFPYWNHTSLFWGSPIVPRDWKIQGRTSSLPSIVPVNFFLNDRGRLLHTCICTITFLRAFNNSLSSVWLLDIPKYYSTQTNTKHPINQNKVSEEGRGRQKIQPEEHKYFNSEC